MCPMRQSSPEKPDQHRTSHKLSPRYQQVLAFYLSTLVQSITTVEEPFFLTLIGHQPSPGTVAMPP